MLKKRIKTNLLVIYCASSRASKRAGLRQVSLQLHYVGIGIYLRKENLLITIQYKVCLIQFVFSITYISKYLILLLLALGLMINRNFEKMDPEDEIGFRKSVVYILHLNLPQLRVPYQRVRTIIL